jgi:hypothetical protein
MPGGGAKPGERRGGRQRGTPNKTTIERQRVTAEIAARTVADARVAGKKLAKEVLEEFMFLFADMAAYYKPALPTAPPNENANEGKFGEYARLTVDAAHKLAPYQSPTFRAIVVAPPPGPDVAKRMRFTLKIFEGERPPGLVEVQPPLRSSSSNG